MRNKLFTLIITLLAGIGTISASVEIDGLYYNLNSNSLTAEVTYKDYSDYYYNRDWNIVNANIPSSVTYNGITYSVTKIGDYAFINCSRLITITLPNSVTSIGLCAFSGCHYLCNINIPDSVKVIEDNTFSNCSNLSTITIPNGVTSIGNSAFYKCNSLTNITIPNNVVDIGEYAFIYCSRLSSVEIGQHATNIGQYAFKECTSLTSVIMGENVNRIGAGAFYGCRNLSSVNIPQSVRDIGENAFYGCISLPVINNIRYADTTYVVEVIDKTLSSYTIKDGTKWIESEAFKNCSNLSSIHIPNSVIGIGYGAFSGCISLPVINNIRYADTTCVVEVIDKTLSSYTIKEGTKWVCGGSFANCFSLTSISIPSSVEYIGVGAFHGCVGLTNVSLPNTITTIRAQVFFNCSSLISITIPESVMHIEDYAFYSCIGLNNVTIPNGVKSIGTCSFEECTSLASISLPNSITSVGSQAFQHCTNLNSLTMGCGILKIKHSAFFMCSNLSSVTLASNLIYIEPEAFRDCISLTSIIIPHKVTNIGSEAFSGCNQLSTINFNSIEPPSLGTNVFDSSPISSIYVPCGSLENYRNSLTSYSNCLKYCPSYSLRKVIQNGSIQESAHSTRCDSIVTLTVKPSNGYHFVQWSDSVTDNPRTIVLAKDTTFTAELAKNSYTVTTASSNNNWGTATGDTTVLYQEKVTLTATPNYGYRFTKWNDGNTTNPRLLTVTKSATYTATFVKNTYNINKVVDAKQGSIAGPTKASYLDSVILAAVPNYGYRFAQWSDSLTDSIRTFVITKDTSFAVEFAKNPVITYNCDKARGYITGDTTLAHSAEGYATFLATQNYGYHFTQWSDGVTDNPRTIHLVKDTTFTAEFAPNMYFIATASSNLEMGTTAGDTIVPYLTKVQISATANYGYHFENWSDGNKINPRTMAINQDTMFTAYFAKNIYSIMTQADSTNGHVSCETQARYLDTMKLTAIPNHGYHFVQWSDSVTDNPRTFVITQDTTFTAEFAQTFAGQCGDSLYWAFANDTLAFSGSGKMYHYATDSLPWMLLTQEVQYIEFAPEMTSVSEYAFQDMKNLRKVNLPSEIITIGESAFANCTSISNLTIPNSVTSLGDGAFYGCSNIDTLIIGTGVTAITNQFRGCTSLRYLQLGQNIRSIDYGSFYDARQLIFIVCHPTLPPLAYPDEVGKERSFYNTNAQVLIPCDNFEAYQYDALWGSFNLKCQTSNSATAVDGQVTVIPGDADAVFTWPTDGSADTYNLEITKDSVVFCTLTFNSQGQLLGIAFAPSANGVAPHAPQAVLTTSGMTFQVTGLDYASHYRFSFETKNAATQTLFAYTGSFHTNGTTAPEGFEDIDACENVQKILLDGTIYILRGDKVYTLQGQLVK